VIVSFTLVIFREGSLASETLQIFRSPQVLRLLNCGVQHSSVS
jgi:hypothetical protein